MPEIAGLQNMGANLAPTANPVDSGHGGLMGALAGFQVAESNDPLAKLMDAAEELGFSVDNTKEQALKDRKTRSRSATASFGERVEQYQKLMEQVSRKDHMESLLLFLKQNRNPQLALGKAREQFGSDVSQMWAALKFARERLQDEAPAEALAAIDTAILELETTSMPRIQAGIVGALTSRETGHSEAPFTDGATYQRVSGDFHDNAQAMFGYLMERYGPEHFEAGLAFLFQSLGNDLASDQPSWERAHLEAVGRGLGQAKVLNGAYILGGRLIDRWTHVHGIAESTLTPPAFLKTLLDLKQESYLSANSLQPLVDAAKPPDIEREVLFLQELLTTSRGFSPLVFDGAEGRMRFIEAVQDAVDQAVAREDEYLASLP